jgi:hypothetical protein
MSAISDSSLFDGETNFDGGTIGQAGCLSMNTAAWQPSKRLWSGMPGALFASVAMQDFQSGWSSSP